MVRYALVGYGKVAHVHAKAIKEAKESTLVAVWGGRNNEKAQSFASEWNIAAFTDIKRMVNEEKVDAVIITTPLIRCTRSMPLLP